MPLQITRGKIQCAQKVVIYGPEGIGKSTFASHFPIPVFIDTEGSTKLLDVARMPNPSSWTILQQYVRDLLDYLKTRQREHFSTLVIDTADWAEQLCMNEICAKAQKGGIEDFGYGKGYVYLAEEFGRFLNLLNDVVEKGVNVVLVAHAQMRKFEQPDEMGSYDRWELKLQKKTAPLVMEWADIVLFANFKTYIVNVDGQGVQKGKNKAQGNKRVMYTTHHQCWDAKNRHGLKDELPLDFSEIAHCLPPAPEMPTEVTEQAKSTSPADIKPVPSMEAGTMPVEEDKKASPPPPSMFAEPTPASDEEIPRALRDLMSTNNVTAEEIRTIVALKGYYPKGTPISNFDPEFITAVLVGAWRQVFEAILEERECPFK